MPQRLPLLVRAAFLMALACALGLGSTRATQTPPAPAAVVGPAVLQAPPVVTPLPDPFPIHRTFLTGDRLATALAQAARGELIKLPRDEFEAKVRAAARAAGPPRLAEARYRASLSDSGLVGTAEWRIASAGQGLLPLDSLRVAASGPRWADGTEAHIVRAGQPAAAHLVVPKSGDTTVSLRWSLRGTEEPAAEQFELAFPVAPIAALDLDLPADRVPVLRAANQLLTGPLPGPSVGRQLWRVAFGGQPKVDLAVRRPRREGDPNPIARTSRFARYDLAPGSATCTFEFDFEAVRGLMPVWTFEADPGLVVTGVTGPGRLNWRREPAAAGRPSRVVVTPQEPVPAGKVTLVGFAPLLAPSSAWTGLQVRFVDALTRNDTLEVRIDPDLKFAGCEPGDFRVVAAGPADRGYRITMTAALRSASDPGTDRRAPTVHVRPAESEVSVVEDVTWRIGLGRSDLTARFRGRVLRGPVSQLVARLSTGLTVTGVRTVPDDPELSWAPQPGAPDSIVIETARPFTTGQAFEFVLEVRGPATPSAPDSASGSGPRMTLPFPRVSLAAAERDGTLTIAVAPALNAWANPEAAGATFSYPYRGRSPDGTLTVAARVPRLTAAADTTIAVAAGEFVSSTRFAARVEDGALDSLTVAVPEVDGVRWEVRADAATVERVPGGELVPWAVALASPWQVGAVPRMSLWRVRFPAPLTGETGITVVARRPAGDTGADLPLPRLLGATGTSPRVLLDVSSARFEHSGVERPGLFPVVRVRPRGEVSAGAPVSTTGWTFANAELATRLVSDEVVESVFSGTVTAANGPVLLLGLPEGAALSTVSVAGKHVDHLAPVTRPGVAGSWAEVPLPQVPEVPFVIRYTLPAHAVESPGAVFPFRRFTSPSPQLPGDQPVVVKWSLAPEFHRWPLLGTSTEPIEADSVTVVAARVVTGIGFGLGAAAVGVAVGYWFVRRRTPSRVGFATVVLVIGVANWTAPPGWHALLRPPLVVGLLALTAFVVVRDRPAPVPPSGARVARHPLLTTVSAAPSVALVLLIWSSARAQAPEPVVVYVVPGPAAAPERLAVMAPQTVLDRLGALVRLPLPVTSILAAEYDGVAVGGSAVITAKFRVLCTRDGDQLLNLPLTGVRLESLDLDGKPAFPDASRADRYVVTVNGPGEHLLTAKFVVPSVAAGAEREARFGVPDLLCTKVRFNGVGAVDVPTRRGAMTTAGREGRVAVDADHGDGRTMAVRWRDGTGTDAKPTVTVREACVWDLSEAGESATAVFLFRVTGGSASRFAIEVPEGLEPTRPVVRTAESRGAGLREWRIDPGPTGWRVVTVQLQTPVDGAVTVTMRLFPTRPGVATPTLRFPRATGATQSDSYYALRLDKVTTNELPRTGVIDLTPDALARDFGSSEELGSGPLDLVFRRAGTEDPEVRPVLRSAAEPPTGSAETVWTVGPRAEAQGVVQSSRPGQTGFEFELPAGVQLHSVRCPDLHNWGRIGSRVQVWLKKPTRDVTLRWTGSLAAVEGVTELPFAQIIGVGPAKVVVRPATGWVVTPQDVRGLKPLPPSRPVEELGYAAEGAAPPPRFAVLPPVTPGSINVSELVERAADGLRYRGLLDVPVPTSRAHHFTLKLPGLPPDVDVEVRGPEGVRVGPVEPGPSWVVSSPPLGEPLVLSVVFRAPLGSPLPVPEVAFGGGPVRATRTLSLGAGLVLNDSRVVDDSPRTAPEEGGGAVPPTPAPDGQTGASDGGPSAGWSDLASALAWVVGLVVVLTSARFGRPDWWPERLLACGVLGSVAVGVPTLTGVLFLGLASIGVLGRLVWAFRHLSHVVLR